MPFGPSWAAELMEIVTSACNTSNEPIVYIRGDQSPDSDIISSIWDQLCQASHVVVDLTGFNANVGIELGMAHTLGRNVLIMVQDDINLQYPLVIAKMRIHRYSILEANGMKSIRQMIDKFLASS